jgi:tripartite ATP-independent transporter DctP family solute receptor
MNRRSVLSLSIAAVAGTAGLAGCGGRPGATRNTVIRLGDDVAEDNPEVTAERFFGDQVSSLTKGRYSVKVFPNATLGDSNRMNEQVRTGTLQMAKSLFSNLTAFDKRLGVLSLPYAFPKADAGFDALAGPLGDACRKILDGAGLVVLAWFYTGTRNVYNTKRAVHSAADLKGLRLRVPQNPVTVDSFNALGAQATPLAATEIYSALQQGVIDGAENNPIYYVTSKQVEEAKNWSWTRHQLGVDVLMVSKKFFGEQPKDVQDALVQAGKATQDKERRLWTAQTDQFLAKAQAAGAKVNDDVDVASMQNALKPVFTKYKSSFGDLMSLLPIA